MTPRSGLSEGELAHAKTVLDGLGRALSAQAGDSTGTQSAAESVYGSCGCSPLGKLIQQAVPQFDDADAVLLLHG